MPTEPTLQLNSYGMVFTARIKDQSGAAQDLTGYTVTFRFRAPSGTVTIKTATPVAPLTDGVANYTMESGVLNETGAWKWQARIVGSTADIYADQHGFSVEANL